MPSATTAPVANTVSAASIARGFSRCTSVSATCVMMPSSSTEIHFSSLVRSVDRLSREFRAVPTRTAALSIATCTAAPESRHADFPCEKHSRVLLKRLSKG